MLSHQAGAALPFYARGLTDPGTTLPTCRLIRQLRAIARELTERGAKTTAGNPWKPTELRRLLVNPRHAGMRVHRGDVIGTGTWPAIIDEDTHRAVSAILADPARRKAGRPRRYLLTALATCGVCGAIVYGVTERRGPLYYCQTRTHVARKAEPIDELVSAVIVARLSLPDARETLAHGEDKARVRALQTEARGVRVKLDGLAEAFAVGDIDRAQLRAGSARLTARAGTIETELGRLVGSGQLRDLASADDMAAAWGALDIDGQRAVIGLLCEVRIYPAGQGARAFDPETVQVEWRA